MKLQHPRLMARSAALDLLGLKAKLVNAEPEPAVHMVYGHYLTPETEGSFRKLLGELAGRYEFVSFTDAVDTLKNGPIDKPIMAWSFDDGYRSSARAAQILEEFGARAALFVCPPSVGLDLAGSASFFHADPSEVEPILTWDELGELKARGHDIGSHTMGHVALAGLSNDELDHQLQASKEAITSELGSCDHFAWPFGRLNCFHPDGLSAVESAGFLSCSSAVRGHHTETIGTGVSTYICRDHVEPIWPAGHGRHFIANSPEATHA